jgi:hypothetical protein
MHFSHLRPSLFAVLAACTLGACSTLKPDAPSEKSAPSRHEATEDAAGSSKPAPAPRPRPPRSDKPKQDKTDRAAPKGETAVEEAPAPPAAEAPLNGPLWLTLCKQRQTEAGIILCDSDELLVRPSAQVKIFTRDPAATGRGIQLRKGLPSKYRFFVVP